MLGLTGKQSVQYYTPMADAPDQIETETRGYIDGIAVTSDLDLCVGYTKYGLDNMRDCLNSAALTSCRESMCNGLVCAAYNLRNVLSSSYVLGSAASVATVGALRVSIPMVATGVSILTLSIASAACRECTGSIDLIRYLVKGGACCFVTLFISGVVVASIG